MAATPCRKKKGNRCLKGKIEKKINILKKVDVLLLWSLPSSFPKGRCRVSFPLPSAFPQCWACINLLTGANFDWATFSHRSKRTRRWKSVKTLLVIIVFQVVAFNRVAEQIWRACRRRKRREIRKKKREKQDASSSFYYYLKRSGVWSFFSWSAENDEWPVCLAPGRTSGLDGV